LSREGREEIEVGGGAAAPPYPRLDIGGAQQFAFEN
jgi:hypothetical protein